MSKIRKRGRSKVGAKSVMVRLLPDQATRLDEWRRSQRDDPGRAEAIRRLLDQCLTRKRGSVKSRKVARKASKLAEFEIDRITNPSLPESEQRARKRRLIKGPREFRDIRKDVPERKS